MAIIRFRKDTKKWGVDYKDAYGKRHWITCPSKKEAKLLAAEKLKGPGGDPSTTFGEIANRWLNIVRASIRPQTWRNYEANLRIHLLPIFGNIKVSRISSGMVLDFLTRKKEELSSRTIGNIHSILHGIFDFAEQHEGAQGNPTRGVRKQLHLKRLNRRGIIRAFAEEQLKRFLDTVRRIAADIYPLLLLLVRTGLRIGEATALMWPDIDFGRRQIRIERTWTDAGLQDVPKTESSYRTVDMSLQLQEELLRQQTQQKRNKLAYGWREMPTWVFCSSNGNPLRSRGYISRRIKKILEEAGLPLHFTAHSLRHTFACLHLQRGVNPVYVQKQLGHSSIQMTVDLYGSWFPISNKAAADALDDVGQGELW